MSKSYRNNLIEYWQQYYPNWQIPAGFHVHQGVPKSDAHKEKLRQNLKGKSWKKVDGKRVWYNV